MNLKLWIYILIISSSEQENISKLHLRTMSPSVSYNEPKLPACPHWNPNGIIFADEISIHSFSPTNLFVTTDRTIYAGDMDESIVQKWTLDIVESVISIKVRNRCYALFIDIANSLYFSTFLTHQVIKQKLDMNENISGVTVAGNGICGSNQNMLCNPRGIFVTIELDLYVADTWNNRIQLFRPGELTGKTVVGNMKTSIILYGPTCVILDADSNLFIVDSNHHRIIRSHLNSFHCIIGCSAKRGSASDQLNTPIMAAFDNVGNIFFTDEINF